MEHSYCEDAHSDSDMYKDLTPDLPRHVVLDASEIIKTFILNINKLECMGIIATEAVADIIMVISRKQEALSKINDRQFEFQLERTGGFPQHELTSYANAWTSFAHSLFQHIETLGLYRNNYLNYQLFQIDNNCLILEKMQYPELNDELFKRFGIVRWHSKNNNHSDQRYRHPTHFRIK